MLREHISANQVLGRYPKLRELKVSPGLSGHQRGPGGPNCHHVLSNGEFCITAETLACSQLGLRGRCCIGKGMAGPFLCQAIRDVLVWLWGYGIWGQEEEGVSLWLLGQGRTGVCVFRAVLFIPLTYQEANKGSGRA